MNWVLSAVMLTAIALILGAIFLWRRSGRASKQVWLMLVLAAVMIVNVLIWTVPDSGGATLVSRAAEASR